ncbi:alpha/beta hydrolase [Croceibacterium ferulae]|uniref:alpha/beta hydrolase n=1 Tax=Croceibacterium ferulae TaxID=1854641 RepID=UPI000EB547AD|nr:hypothetical protein [Croceibacterium ferulae]
MSRPVIVALHGVGSSAADMAAVLAPLERVADVIALDGCEPFDRADRGRQWFSIAGVTEADRPRRVAEALPRVADRLQGLAGERGLALDELVLLGFSQGAIMTLAMVAQGLHRGRAIAVAGRLASPVLPPRGPAAPVLLVHDSTDRVMPPILSDDAAAQLGAAGHIVTAKSTTGVGHTIGRPTLSAITDWLATSAQSPLTPASIEG